MNACRFIDYIASAVSKRLSGINRIWRVVRREEDLAPGAGEESDGSLFCILLVFLRS